MENEEMVVDVLDSAYPLMVLLKEVIPGTYNHSKNVASMLEAIGTELKLDVQALKIAGFYHDIGKSVNPRFFTENQTEDEPNPHDDLEPRISHKIITSHIGETTQILINDPNIPRKVVEICSQHHGTCILKYFFNKSKAEKPSTNPDNYRYKTKTPQSIEAGLLMIVDQIEATSRALDQAGKLNDIDGLVNGVIEELSEKEKQLDDFDISFPKIRAIKRILKHELAAQFHKRIDYDQADSEEPVKGPKKRKGARVEEVVSQS